MKTLYLTSSHVGRYRGDSPLSYHGLNPMNGLCDELKKDWREGKCLFFCSDPNNHPFNDYMAQELRSLLLDTGLPVQKMDVCDSRRREFDLSKYDFLFLCGGHVPTQLRFFWSIFLKEKLESFDGIVMGVSAGSMNQATLVYAQPEERGETSPLYQRWLKGLGLTELNVIPHYQAVKDDWLDGQRVFEDITYGDSYGKKFYTLVDGSYILVRDQSVLYGEGYLISEGTIKKICEEGETLVIEG